MRAVGGKSVRIERFGSHGDGGAQDLTAGQAVVFDPGEEHETRAVTAATLAIMEWVAG